MYVQGHTVYGVEFLEKIVKGFFEDNSLPYDIAHVENVGKVYKVRRKWNIYIKNIRVFQGRNFT